MTNSAFRREAEFEELLHEISATFLESPVSEIEGHFDFALRRVIETLGLDRGTITLLEGDDKVRVAHSWALDGVERAPLEDIAVALPYGVDLVRRNRVFSFSRLAALTTAAALFLMM